MPSIEQKITENRVVLNHITWETFNQIIKELGEKRVIRLAYDQGIVEIMTPFGQHEYSNRFIDNLIILIALELNLNIKTMGSLTLKKEMVKKGVEPDSCYYLNNEPLVRNKQDIRLDIDPPPDLVSVDRKVTGKRLQGSREQRSREIFLSSIQANNHVLVIYCVFKSFNLNNHNF